MRITSVSGAVLLAATAAGSSAWAATVDLTDSATYDVRTPALAQGSLASGVTWSITSPSGDLTYTAFDGIDSPLADEFDGIGVINDELSNNGGPSEYLYLQFSAPVTLTGFHFMDLFEEPGVPALDQEMAFVYVGQLGDIGSPDFTFDADEAYAAPASGYKFGEGTATSSMFTFAVSEGNDNVGVGDYSFAGFDVAPIPLPAGLLLLGTGIAGLGLMRRRKSS